MPGGEWTVAEEAAPSSAERHCIAIGPQSAATCELQRTRAHSNPRIRDIAQAGGPTGAESAVIQLSSWPGKGGRLCLNAQSVFSDRRAYLDAPFVRQRSSRTTPTTLDPDTTSTPTVSRQTVHCICCPSVVPLSAERGVFRPENQ